ncbi:prepilin peptidase [Catenulispora sp. NL8]|uniref:Prepilin peptidase n=1 Tax=Catenulispora pinistramenti TaxID=2705254 RepID=A0ABS5KN59_9ACTN|nr:A24 family peptidase [Catenulispora pinistramenti]MBS2547457.1 prepilin peptidase [Catenulispora pinistramenti]
MDRTQVPITTIGHQARVLRATRPVVTSAVIGAVVAASLLVVRLGMAPQLPAYLYFVVVGVPLAAIDATTGKLPDCLTLPSYPILVIMFCVAEGVSPDQGSTVRAAAAAILLVALFFASAFVRGVGLGDVKLAGLLGLVIGFRSWTAVYTGMLAAFVLAAIFIVFSGIRAGSSERIPLGPFLVAGTLVAVIL